MKNYVLLILSLCLLAGCDSKSTKPSPEAKKAREEYLSHPLGKLETWEESFKKPFSERLGEASDAMIHYVKLDNIANGFPNNPSSVPLDAELRNDFTAAVAELPVDVIKALDNKFAGLFFVDDLGGTGFTSEIRNEKGEDVAGFILLDATVLQRTANSWASWKDSTVFKEGSEYSVELILENEDNNNRKNALQFILLHELGHVLSINQSFHPSWNSDVNEETSLGDYPFTSVSWKVNEDKDGFNYIYEDDFPNRSKLTFYFGPRLENSDIPETYQQLEQTNFISLYGSTNVFEDFAEFFAVYIHTAKMGKPYEVNIYQGSEKIHSLDLNVNSPRFALKKILLEQKLF